MSFSKSQKESDLPSVIAAFKSWRNNREKICRIPDHLWELAASLWPRYPVDTIRKNLGLNWGDLKKKIDQLSVNHSIKSSDRHPNPSSTLPSFVELKLSSQEPSSFLNPCSRTTCAIELTKPDGTMMKILAPDNAPLNLLELCKTFLETNAPVEFRGTIGKK